jgi:DNA-directed RNA polymerase subunit RPC12/RpoP
MTVRLRCAECQRKLKVPDEAIGKKVQCPACGARFIGRLDGEASPASPTSPPPLQQPPLEMMASSPPEEPSLAPTAPPEPTVGPPSLPNLELEEPLTDAEPAAIEAVEAVEAVEPAVVEEAATEAVDPIVVEDETTEAVEPVVVEETVTTEAVDPIVVEDEAASDVDAVEVAEEAEEDKPAKGDKGRPKKKKSRRLLCGCLAAVGFVMLLGCGGGGFFGYRFWTGYVSDDDWKTTVVPEASCIISLPGDPVSSVQSPGLGRQVHLYVVEKPLARSQFQFAYYDLPSAEARPELLGQMLNVEINGVFGKLNPSPQGEFPLTLQGYQGREARVKLPAGRAGIIRIYLAPHAGQTRVYVLAALAPNLEPNSGPGGRFFNSFAITGPSPSGPGQPGAPPNFGPQPQPGPGRNKGPRP